MGADPLEKHLEDLEKDLSTYFAKAAEEQKTNGTALTETKSAIDLLQKQFDALVIEMKKPHNGIEHKSIGEQLKENEQVSRLLRDRKGSAYITFEKGLPELEQKTTVTSTALSTSGNDYATSGVMNYDRVPGIVMPARRKLFIQDLLTEVPTRLPKIDYVKIENDIGEASPQVEGEAKYENAMTFTTAEASVRTIATWIPATKQILEDFEGLEAILRQSLVYAVRKEEEDQILTGDNTGENLNGLITQATAFDTGLLVAGDGWEYADMVGRAIQQIEVTNEAEPDFVALNPAIWWGIRLQKSDDGSYIYGNPTNGASAFQLFGLTVVRSNALSSTQFLVGSSAPTNAVIRRRLGIEVEISTEHSDFFVKNKVAIRAESRLALVVFRAGAFIKGTFTQSPA